MKIAHSLLVAAVGGALAATTVACGDSKPPQDPSATNPAGAATGGPAAPEAKHACKGQNDCKGKGGCKTDKHGCKGQNDCKGQGGCKG